MTSPRAEINIIEAIRNSSRDRAAAQRKLAEFGMGVLNALREGRMDIEQAERDLFNMDSCRNAKRFRLNPKFLEFLEYGMQLEDVVELAPEAMEESFTQMQDLIASVLSDVLGETNPEGGSGRQGIVTFPPHRAEETAQPPTRLRWPRVSHG